MEGLYAPTKIAGLLRQYGAAPLKKLGQNFLRDENVVNKIARASVEEGENILEIGPGLGVLTDALAKRARRVAAVEVDAAMVRILTETLADRPGTRVLHQDILKTDLKAVGDACFDGQPFAVAGNLPYYITSKCLLHVLESGAPVIRLTAMVQAEVADRLEALPGSREYGAITASIAYYGTVRRLFSVSRRCFFPEPEVDSAVVQLEPREPLAADRAAYAGVVRGLFAMRRKTVLNNLRSGWHIGADEARALLERAGIDADARAERLSPADFVRLANMLYK